MIGFLEKIPGMAKLAARWQIRQGGAQRTANPEEALRRFRRAVARAPGWWEAWYRLADTQQDLGQLEAAADGFRKALALKPTAYRAHNNLGLALVDLGRPDEAKACFEAALALKPDLYQAYFNLGNLHADQGEQEKAAACYRRALIHAPDFAPAHRRLGDILMDQRQWAAAEACFRQALELEPRLFEAHNNLGLVLSELDRLDEAVACFRLALEIKPDLYAAHNNLGNALRDQGKTADAIACYRLALQGNPELDAVYNNLGNALRDQGASADAIAHYRKALALNPKMWDIYNNLGSALWDEGQYHVAIEYFQKAITLQPNNAAPHNNLGIAFQSQRRVDEAIACYSRALKLDPDFHLARFNYATALLLQGRYREGWPEYEARWQEARRLRVYPREFREPRWDGGPLQGKTLLLWAEQGLGDTLHFARYAALVAKQGGRVLLECQPPLQRLLATVPGPAAVFAEGEPLPKFDLQCPLLSLPLVLGTTLETIPATVPYLFPAPERTAQWGKRLPPSGGPRVGLVWAGEARKNLPDAHRVDRRRSLRLDQLVPLFSIPGISWVSLQKGIPAQQRPKVAGARAMLDWMDEVTDFADTAALAAHLDLVITVDTSMAHLAGALGKPTWMLSRFDGCWRWLLDREDSPWYPTLRIFRQEAPGQWEPVIARLRQELERWVAERAATRAQETIN